MRDCACVGGCDMEEDTELKILSYLGPNNMYLGVLM